MSQIRFEHEEGSEIRVPRWALASMGGLVGVALALAAIASLTGFGAVENPASVTGGEVLLTFAFQPQEDGSLTVVRHPEGDPIQTVAPGEGGFLRGVVRPLERERVRLERERQQRETDQAREGAACSSWRSVFQTPIRYVAPSARS